MNVTEKSEQGFMANSLFRKTCPLPNLMKNMVERDSRNNVTQKNFRFAFRVIKLKVSRAIYFILTCFGLIKKRKQRCIWPGGWWRQKADKHPNAPWFYFTRNFLPCSKIKQWRRTYVKVFKIRQEQFVCISVSQEIHCRKIFIRYFSRFCNWSSPCMI
jgi:hypothetical protein